jgi:hypothetical protein
MTDNHSLQPGAAALTLVGYTPRVLSDLELNPSGRFFNFVLTYLIASAGLTPVYDGQTYPDFMKNTSLSKFRSLRRRESDEVRRSQHDTSFLPCS